jgi:hypothetical protein
VTVYDLFYEGPNGEVYNAHEIAYDANTAAEAAADAIRDGSPWVQVELRRTQADIDAMLERRKAKRAGVSE